MDDSTAYIYALCDPETDKIRYIGKANNPPSRFSGHLGEARRGKRRPVCDWIRSLDKRGLKPTWRVVETCPQSIWREVEREWIALLREYGGPKLLNICDGGEGNTGSTPEDRSERMKRWWADNPDEKQRLSQQVTQWWEENHDRGVTALREKVHPKNKGLVRSAEHRAKISAIWKGRKRGPMDEEGKRKRSETMLARGPEPELRVQNAVKIAVKVPVCVRT